MPEYLTTQEVASQLRLSIITVAQYAKKRIIKGVKMGKRWLFTKEDILEYVNRVSQNGSDDNANR